MPPKSDYTIDKITPDYPYTTPETALFLRCHRATVINLIDSGLLGCINPPFTGGRYKVLGRHIKSYLEAKEKKPTAFSR